MKRTPVNFICLAAVLLLSIAGTILGAYASANGPWGYSDPVAYITTARSLNQGLGLGYIEASGTFEYFTIQPPFYSLVLSVFGFLGADLVAAARWLNLAAFALSIFIAGWIFIRFTRTPWLGIAASALLCAFPHMVEMFSSAYSEPLFILLFLAGGLCLLGYLDGNKIRMMVLAVLLFGMLPLTRYAGMAMLVAAALSLLFFAGGKFLARLLEAILFTLTAGLPVAAWLAWVYFASTPSLGGRSLELDTSGLADKFQAFRGIFMDTIWKWIPFQSSGELLAYRLRFILLGVALAGLIAACFYADRRLRRESYVAIKRPETTVFTFFLLASLAYVLILIGTYLFTMPTIDVDDRMLLPLFVSLVITLPVAWSLWQAAWFRSKLRLLVLLPLSVAALFVLWYIPQAKEKAELYHPGGGLTAFRWDSADIVQAMRGLPAGQPVISNDWEVLWLWTDRPVHGLWSTFPVEPPMQEGSYGSDARDDVQVLFCAQDAALVIFDDFWPQFRERTGTSAGDPVPELFDGLTVAGIYSRATVYLCP